MPFSFRSFVELERGRRSTTVVLGSIVSLSLANLCYLRVWDLLLHNPDRNYLTSVPYGRIDYLAAILGVLALAAVLYGVVTIVWHHENRWLRSAAMLAVFLVFLFPLDFVRRSSGASFEAIVGIGRYALIGGAVVGLFSLALIFRQRFYAALFWLLAIVSPYAAFTLGHAVLRLLDPEEMAPPRLLAESAPAKPVANPRRLIWIIFDEWDQAMISDRRPAELKLPHLDALMQESVVATRAYAPSQATRISLPALLTGRLVSEAVGTRDSRLQIRFSGDATWQSFRSSDTIITDALRDARKTAVLGWYHPYDRILPQSPNLTAKSFGFPAFEAIRGEAVPAAILAQYAYLGLPVYGRMESRDLYVKFHAEALGVAADPETSFAFLHYSIPHSPGFYDARKRDFSVALASEMSGYVNNLALVDRTLGELLAALEKAGLRDSTALILTSDHWWRSAPWVKSRQGYPVPLVIQVKRGGPALRVDVPLCTVSLRPIAGALLSGRLSDHQGVAAALHREAVAGEIRYVNGVMALGPAPAGAAKPGGQP